MKMVGFRFRWIVVLVVGVLLWAGSGGPCFAADVLSDEDKRLKIQEMYANYKKKSFPDVSDIEPREAMRLAASRKVVFIDVRELKEQKVSMLPGAITEKDFMRNPKKYDDHIKIGYCTISYRSGKLAQTLKTRDIAMVNLKGGLLAWVHDGGKVYDHKGETRRIHVYARKWNLVPKKYQAIW